MRVIDVSASARIPAVNVMMTTTTSMTMSTVLMGCDLSRGLGTGHGAAP